MKIKFWGTRGSIAVSDPAAMRYGGDTSCVEVRVGDTLLIFDAGTGIRRLGASLMSDPTFKGTGHILLSHFHWDHIQGFPFFRPAFVSGNTFKIYGAFRADSRLEDCMRGQMGSLYFPIEMSDMPGTFEFIELLEQDVEVEGLKVTSGQLNHPQGCYGYRVETPDGIVTYCTDTEPYPDRLDEKVIELAKDADVFICDCQFTPEEYQAGKQGWGHSTWHDAATMARQANVKQLVLYHHDPYHSDDEVDKILGKARELFPNTIAAYRDLELVVEAGGPAREASADRPAQAKVAPAPKPRPARDPAGGKPQVRETGETLILDVPRDLAIFNSEAFRNAALGALKDSHKKMLLNLTHLGFLDSSGIGSLAAIFNEAKRREVEMALCNPSDQILNVLRITRFTRLTNVFKTEQEALQGGSPLAS